MSADTAPLLAVADMPILCFLLLCPPVAYCPLHRPVGSLQSLGVPALAALQQGAVSAEVSEALAFHATHWGLSISHLC